MSTREGAGVRVTEVVAPIEETTGNGAVGKGKGLWDRFVFLVRTRAMAFISPLCVLCVCVCVCVCTCQRPYMVE